MNNKTLLKLTPLLIISLFTMVYFLMENRLNGKINQGTPDVSINTPSTVIDSDKSPGKKYENEFVIFFSQNMAEKTAQKLFFEENKNIQWIQDGNFAGVVVVKIEVDQEETLNMLKSKDYIDLIIPNQDGLECHSETNK